MNDSLKDQSAAQLRSLVSIVWRRCWQWLVMVAIAVVAIVLGYIGLTKYFAAAGQTRSLWDICYFILCLFVAEAGEISGAVPWELQAARLLAPVAPAWAILKALAAIFHERLQMLRLRCTIIIWAGFWSIR